MASMLPDWLARVFGAAPQDQQAAASEQKKVKCVFCSIVAGTVPATIVFQDERVIALKDIRPSAELHYLVIPRDHSIRTVKDLSIANVDLVAHMQSVGTQILNENGKSQDQQRFAFHVPPFNTINHLHLHCIGLPYKGTFHAYMFGEGVGSWQGWVVEAKKLFKSLEDAKARGVDEYVKWDWSWLVSEQTEQQSKL